MDASSTLLAKRIRDTMLRDSKVMRRLADIVKDKDHKSLTYPHPHDYDHAQNSAMRGYGNVQCIMAHNIARKIDPFLLARYASSASDNAGGIYTGYNDQPMVGRQSHLMYYIAISRQLRTLSNSKLLISMIRTMPRIAAFSSQLSMDGLVSTNVPIEVAIEMPSIFSENSIKPEWNHNPKDAEKVKDYVSKIANNHYKQFIENAERYIIKTLSDRPDMMIVPNHLSSKSKSYHMTHPEHGVTEYMIPNRYPNHLLCEIVRYCYASQLIDLWNEEIDNIQNMNLTELEEIVNWWQSTNRRLPRAHASTRNNFKIDIYNALCKEDNQLT
jgi:hypothetical protein